MGYAKNRGSHGLFFSAARPESFPKRRPFFPGGMLAGSATSTRRLAHSPICVEKSECFSSEIGSPSLIAWRSSAGLLGMVQATTSILTGDGDPWVWIKMLIGYDIIFATVSLLLFDVVFHAE